MFYLVVGVSWSGEVITECNVGSVPLLKLIEKKEDERASTIQKKGEMLGTFR